MTADRQDDLFADYLPVRRRQTVRAIDLTLRIKTAMGQALKECPDSALVIAARMTELMGREITEDALYACTAPSKREHDMGIVRFVAFVRATGATWLWDELVHDDGLVVLEGREARLAQLGHIQQELRKLGEVKRRLERDLNRQPVRVRRRNEVAE